MRQLSPTEEKRLEVLTQKSISLALIEPTETGLKKSIMDATGNIRTYLREKCFHDYELQLQGPKSKVLASAIIYTANNVIPTTASLYRPLTKQGDPRIWFYNLANYVDPNDILAIICFDEKIHLFNLTKLPVEKLIESALINPLKELVTEINLLEKSISNELLQLLVEVARRGPILSEVNADTSVGRTLETALGIDINSSMQPDYKGIELKSYRGNKGNRKNLFAQVPDWKLSKLKSSSEILDNFGYWRGEDFKLYCTVSANTINSQGLSLKLNSSLENLVEYSDKKEIGDFIVWKLEKLHQRLLYKHRETFWVEAESTRINNKEYFQYRKIEHTKKPITSQFDILLEQGIITVDHLIKRDSRGRVVEKGPLFKIKPKSLNLLFPPSEIYHLLE